MSGPQPDLLHDDRIPICVGVTGHRNTRAEDEPKLEAVLEETLRVLMDRYSYSPVALLSPLAEGADRIAARVALRLGIQLVATLPNPREAYLEDFESEASRQEFDALLAQAVFSVTLPPVATAVERYRQVGAYVVRHSHTLLALWDGLPSERPGGTADVVRMKLEGPPAPYAVVRSALDPPELGPILHLQTPRQGTTPGPDAFGVTELYPPHPGGTAVAKREAEIALEHIDRANRDITQLLSGRESAIRARTQTVVPEAETRSLSAGESLLLQRFAVLDVLAVHCQKRRRQTWVGLFAMVLGAYGAFEIYDNLALQRFAIGLAYPAILVLAFVAFRLASQLDHHTRHLDYRTLAEGLRVQLFWRIAGLSEQVSDRYLRKQGGELHWIREAIRACNLLPDADAAAPPPLERCERVARCWVGDQESYFGRASRRHEQGMRRLGGASQGLYFASIVLTLSVLVLDFAVGQGFALPVPPGLLRGATFVAIALSLALSAALQGYAEKMVLAEEAKQYDRMREVLERATLGLSTALEGHDVVAAQALLRELGDEALQENGDWIIMHRSQRIELPSG